MTTMTLEQVRDWHRALAGENAGRRALCSPDGERWELWNDEFNKHSAMADAIDAHLATREVTTCDFCGGDCSAANPPVNSCPLITQGIDAAIDHIQADRQRGVGVVDIPDAKQTPTIHYKGDLVHECGYVSGWNAYRQALLAQRGQVRDGLSAWVSDMSTSAGMDYYVCVGRSASFGEYLTPSVYKIRGRAEYEVAEWNHLLGLAPKPDILAFDTEPKEPDADAEGKS